MAETENAGVPLVHNDEGDDNDRAQRNAGRQAAASGSSSLLMLVILTWQAIEISKYSESFLGSVISGKHVALNDSCSSLFWVTNWSLFLTLFMVVLDGTISVLAFRRMGVLGELSKIGDGLLGIAGLLKLGIAFMGIWIICFDVEATEADACSSLYVCAWWCFVGILLLPIALSCCMCCFALGIAVGQGNNQPENGDAGTGLTVAGARPMYGGAMAQPQPPAADFKPFSGSGQKLGDDEGTNASSV